MLERRVRLILLCSALVALTGPAAGREVVDSAGRTVVLPEKIERVFAAGPPAAVVLSVLAPEKLVGWPTRLREGTRPFLRPSVAALPELGRLTGRGDTANLEVVLKANPDVVVDFGTVAPTYVSLADRVQAQTHIPVALVDGRFAATPASIRLLGKILGVEARAEEIAKYAEETFALVDRVLAGVPVEKRPRVYLARSANGLETGLEGSINTEILERAGGRNVAERAGGRAGLAQVSLEQVLSWNPDWIVTLDRNFADSARADASWSPVAAIKDNRLLLSPDAPFGWIDGPPSVNRLIGLRWLTATFFPGRANLDLRQETNRFYRLFYGVELDDALYAALIAGRDVRP
jgi:iron complex transport system substrate-binding protein